VVKISGPNRNSRSLGYLHFALKVVGIAGLIGALHTDKQHAHIYVPAIVAVALSHKVLK
jgi:hypothetical protein